MGDEVQQVCCQINILSTKKEKMEKIVSVFFEAAKGGGAERIHRFLHLKDGAENLD